MKPVNKHTVLKEVRQNGTWEGMIAPNKALPNGPWHIGMDILLAADRQGNVYSINLYRNSPITMPYEELETMLNAFKYYNCNSELGQRIRFWQD
jgi:hypothetical protein